MEKNSNLLHSGFYVLLVLGILLRLGASALGHNYDLESYWLVSEIVLAGESVYSETERYNYGPIWFLLLGALRRLSISLGNDNLPNFHFVVASFLTIIDCLICLILRAKMGVKSALFYYLNPVSILITGYHSQFDNFALLLGFIACIELSKLDSADIRRKIFAACLLGLSLSVKHILAFFPIWLWYLNRKATTINRLLLLLVPYCLFTAILFPFALDSRSLNGILNNVLKYNSEYGNGLISQSLNLFTDIKLLETLSGLSIAKGLFVIISMGAVLVFKSSRTVALGEVDYLLIFLLVLVTFSSSMTDQYLAIPLIAISKHRRFISGWIYSLAATLILLTSRHNIFGERFVDYGFVKYHHAQICLLFLLIALWRFQKNSPKSLMVK